jgi:hypothetical protein
MAQHEHKIPTDQPSDDEDVERSLDDAAKAARQPHDDSEEREQRRKAAEHAERNPRRQGEGIHPGSH